MPKMLSSVDFKRMLSALVTLSLEDGGEDELGEWATGFIRSVSHKVESYLGGSVMDLSQKQLDKIEELYDKHC